MEKIVEIKLISEIISYDSIGVPVKTTSETAVIGNFESVSSQEFFRAGETGLKPEMVLKVWASEYSGQKILSVGGKPFSIYRTYQNDDGRVELYCSKDVGI